MKRARLAIPVRESWKAWWVSCSSRVLRSVISRALMTSPPTLGSWSRLVMVSSQYRQLPSHPQQEGLAGGGLARGRGEASAGGDKLVGQRGRRRQQRAQVVQPLGEGRHLRVARWLGGWVTDIQHEVASAVSTITGSGSLPVFVAYNIPNRDCGSYSAGGANGEGLVRD